MSFRVAVIDDEEGVRALLTRILGARGYAVDEYATCTSAREGLFANPPDLIICDDVEDSSSAQDRSLAEAFGQWFESEILPLGKENTKIIILGNLLTFYWADPWIDRRSFILRLRDDVLHGKIKGIFRAYPLIDDQGKNLWRSRYPNRKAVLALRTRVSLGTWIREYLLKSYAQDNEEGPNISFWNDFVVQELAKECPGLYDRKSHPKQKALIPQMREFIIRAPQHTMYVFDSPYDPEYQRFLDDWYFYPNKEDLEKRISEDRKEYER